MLELSGLTRRFGSVTALDGLSFTVGPGEVFGFVGSNGAGKTTTMRIAMGLLRADAGSVTWQGRPLTSAQRRRFGYMPEERGLYPRMRIGDQLVYFGRLHGMTDAAAKKSSAEWLERFGLADRRDDRLEKLSLGNQQRVQLAAAMVHNPELLILDEPFSGLDPVGVDEMSEALQTYAAQGVPVLFSSHQLELVERLCDGVAVIDKGRLVAGGRVEDLVREGRQRQHTVAVVVATKDESFTAAQLLVDVPQATVVSERRGSEGLSLTVRAPDEQTLDAFGQAVLAAALRAGAVRSFGHTQPRLSELYREAVSR